MWRLEFVLNHLLVAISKVIVPSARHICVDCAAPSEYVLLYHLVYPKTLVKHLYNAIKSLDQSPDSCTPEATTVPMSLHQDVVW